MTYARVMVPVDLGPSAADRIKLAGSLADQLGSVLIGIAAQQPFVPTYGDGYVANATLIESEQSRVAADLIDVERVFREACGNRKGVEWRSSSSHEATAFAIDQGRAADILVLTRQGSKDTQDWRFGVDPGRVVLELGRPIIVGPPGVASMPGKRVVIAWKDTREARRAVWDALPLLKRADEVLVVAIAESGRSAGAADLGEYLAAHAVKARTLSLEARDISVADHILKTVDAEKADFLVAGAYGHTRVREWIFGGVSQDLLDHTPVCCLLSH